MAQKSVLIVEDEITQSTLLEGIISRAGHVPFVAHTGQEALDFMADRQGEAIDIVLLDLVMPGMDGLEVLENLRPKFPNLPVIMLTAHSSITTVVDAMRAGASDFIVKPASAERIRTAISAGLETSALVGEIEPMQKELSVAGFESLVGDGPAMSHALGLARKAATASIPILIDGESGVGKEVFARAIHGASVRAGKPFVAVNCGAIPENLVESILFGHEKGAFTGATEKRIGKFEEANGGTLFLDEVGELPADVQVKLLRALQEKEIDPVGGKASIKVDIRVISATNRNLADCVAEGTFREDLFYRLNVYPINLPPLRERREDIPALVDHFLHLIPKMEGLSKRSITPAALKALVDYHWPGNIRQLQNAIFRAVILSDHETLEVQDFPHLHGLQHTPAAHPVAAPPAPHSMGTVPAVNGISSGMSLESPLISLVANGGHVRTLAEIECEVIRRTIGHYDGKMAEVARRLGIGRSTLYRKLEEYDLKR